MEPMVMRYVCNEVTGKLNTYKKNKDIKNLLKYIAGQGNNKENEEVIYVGTRGLHKNWSKAAIDIINMQKIKKKDKDKRRMYHLVISFPADISDPDVGKKVAINVMNKIKNDGFQIFCGVHNSTDNMHIHFAINAVSYKIKGGKYHIGKGDVVNMRRWITEMAIGIIIGY